MLPIKRARRGKRERAILTVIPWDVWAAAAIAAVGIILAVVFDQAPLLVFFLVGLALCTYIAIRNRFGDEDETPVENLDQSQKSESASGNASDDGTF